MTSYRMAIKIIGKEIDEFTSNDIAKFKEHRLKQGLKRSTIKKDLMALSSLYEYLVSSGQMKNNPVDNIQVPSLKRSERIKINYLDHEDCLLLIGEPLKPKIMKPSKIAYRDHIMIKTLYYSGIRPIEVRNLQWKHISFTNKTIFIEDSKGHNSRLIEVSESLIKSLQEYYKKSEYTEDTDKVFRAKGNDSISTDAINYTVKKYAKRLDLEARGNSKTVTAYTLRHSYAVRMTEKGVSERVLGEMMGNQYAVHHYAHITKKGKRRAAQLFDSD